MGIESILSGITNISDGGRNTAAEFREVLTDMTETLSGCTDPTVTEHIDNALIHFEQSGITITESQISDLKPYLTGYTETDTLDSVISRGNITSNGIYVDSLSAHTMQLNNLSGETGVGEFIWNEEYGTAELGLRGGNVRLQIGQEVNIFVRADVDLVDGDIVYYTGVFPDPENPRMKVDKYLANGATNPVLMLGVVTEHIQANNFGFITTFGIINNLDTTGDPFGESWNQGDILYASPTVEGQLTNIEPISPNLRIKMAVVVRSHPNFGTIMVRPTVGYYMSDLHDLSVSGLTDGSYLVYDLSSGLWRAQPLIVDAPTLSGDTGTIGTIAYDSDYFYTCVDTNTWKRTPLSGW